MNLNGLRLVAIGVLCLTPLVALSQPEFESLEVWTDQSRSILFWDQMDSKDRAELWSILTQEQRLIYWRMMTREERQAMHSHMTALEIPSFRLRFMAPMRRFNLSPSETRPMTVEERDVLRTQVRAVRRELSRGIPYNCTDPRNCPKGVVVDDLP